MATSTSLLADPPSTVIGPTRVLARRLLDRQLVRCDEEGFAVWLETTDPANPPIYERFGLEVATHLEDAAWLPGWRAMRREPRSL